MYQKKKNRKVTIKVRFEVFLFVCIDSTVGLCLVYRRFISDYQQTTMFDCISLPTFSLAGFDFFFFCVTLVFLQVRFWILGFLLLCDFPSSFCSCLFLSGQLGIEVVLIVLLLSLVGGRG